MRNVASIVLVWIFIAGLILLPVSRVPPLAASASVLLAAACALCTAAATGLVLITASRRLP